MDDSKWLRIIIVGLVLAALAIGYYLLSGVFSLGKTNKPQTKVNTTLQNSPAPNTSSNPSIVPSASPAAASLSPQSAYQRIVERNQSQVQALPKTGLPAGFLGLLSLSIMVTGLGLRKFPN